MVWASYHEVFCIAPWSWAALSVDSTWMDGHRKCHVNYCCDFDETLWIRQVKHNGEICWLVFEISRTWEGPKKRFFNFLEKHFNIFYFCLRTFKFRIYITSCIRVHIYHIKVSLIQNVRKKFYRRFSEWGIQFTQKY